MRKKQKTPAAPAEQVSRTGLHEAVKPRHLSLKLPKKHIRYLLICLFAVFILLVSAVMILNSAERKNYDERMAQATQNYNQARYEDALRFLRSAAEIEASEECLLLMADCYDRLGNFDKALELLRTLDVSKANIQRKIAATEQKKSLLSQVEKVTVAGQQVPINSNALLLDDLGITDSQLSEILQLYALENLSLAGNALTDLSALSTLGGLSTLNVSGNQISDLLPLQSLSSLRTLYLDHNPITDLSPLYAMSNLANLSIKGIPITESELAALSAALPNCAIHSETASEDVLDITIGGVTFKSDVTELDLSGLGISDLSALAECKNLQKLNLRANAVSDLCPLMNLPELERLNVSENQLTDLRPLMGMSKLQVLNVSGNRISGTAALGSMSGLKELDLSGNAVGDFSGLKNLRNLRVLSIKNTGLTDDAMGALCSLSGLTRLEIDDNPGITGEAVDDMMQYLPKCELSHSQLVYNVYVENIPVPGNATELDLSASGISDISGLGNLGSLVSLDLSQNSISNIYIFQHTNSRFGMKNLDLSGNMIEDISAMSTMMSIEVLDLSGNRINSVQPLMHLSTLRELYLQGNPLTEEQIRELQQSLPDCSIVWE